MYGAEHPRKRVCSSRTMVMKRCEDSDSAGLVSTHYSYYCKRSCKYGRAQRTAVTVVTTVLSSHIYGSSSEIIRGLLHATKPRPRAAPAAEPGMPNLDAVP